jgi:hypothetical protein
VRLDHLLSKEHHEKHPNWWGVSREGFSSVVGGGLVRDNKEKPDTLLGPEATPVLLRELSPPSWWWGVVFENWIVVASINWMRCP